MKAKKYYQCDKDNKPIRSTFDISLYAADHPNKRNSMGETFNEELARVCHDATMRFGYDHIYRDSQAPVKRVFMGGQRKVLPMPPVGKLGGQCN